MNAGVWFAVALMTLDGCAAAAYLWDGDLRRAIYWTAAGVLTLTVTI